MNHHAPGPCCAIRLLAPAALLVSSVAAQTVVFTPEDANFQLDPGQQASVHAQVCFPGQVAKADIYLLADTTTSMTPILNQIKANAQQIVSTLLSTPNVDIRVGCGQYRDFPFDAQPFAHEVSPVYDENTVTSAIGNWVAGGGGDGSEGQFYALYQLATDPSIGFRPDAKRIIVWFGDSPAHDPICAIFNGGGVPTFEIDEALVTSALQGNGPGGATVLAIGTSTGYPSALNDDPTLFAEDYGFFCSVGGTSGQADRLATATNGLSTQINDPVQITAAILDAVNSVLTEVDVGAEVLGAIAPFVTSIVPPFYDNVALPNDPNKEVCVDFDFFLEGPPCGENILLYEGAAQITLNGSPLDSHPVTITQPDCYEPIGLVLIGIRRIEGDLLTGGDPNDLLLVAPGINLLTSFDQIPGFLVPDDQVFFGFEIFAQCALSDPLAYPGDPIKASAGLQVQLGFNDLGTLYGTASGLDISLTQPALIGGVFQLACSVSP